MGGCGHSRVVVWRDRLVAAAAALVVGWALWQVVWPVLSVVLGPLLVAGLIVYLLDPPVSQLQQMGVPRLLGTALLYVAVVSVLVLGVVVAVPMLVAQLQVFVGELPTLAVSAEQTLEGWLEQAGMAADLDLAANLDPSGWADGLEAFSAGESSGLVGRIVSGASSAFGRMLHVLLLLVAGPVLAFYLLVDLPNLKVGVRRWLPDRFELEVLELAGRIAGKVGAYLRGQLLVSAFVGVASVVALALVGLPFYVVVGLLAGLFNLVPLIGPFVGGGLGVVVALATGGGMSQAVGVVVAMTVVQQIDNHVLSPQVMARSVKLHPVTVMVVLMAAGSLWGLVGMLVVVPVVASVKLVALHVLGRHGLGPEHLHPEPLHAVGDGVEPDPARVSGGSSARGGSSSGGSRGP